MTRRTIVGTIFIVAGLLKLASMWNVLQLEWLWQQPWTDYFVAFLLLYFGSVMVINGFRHNRDQWLQRPLPLGDDGKRICCVARFGGDEYVYRGEPFHGARLDAVCGGIRLDLRDAVIAEDEAIDIRTCLGGVELFVPLGVNVVVESRSFLGGVGNETRKHADKHACCLHIVASNVLGGVSVRN